MMESWEARRAGLAFGLVFDVEKWTGEFHREVISGKILSYWIEGGAQIDERAET